MVNCVRHRVLPRLKKGAGLPFFFPLLTIFTAPLFEGLFFAPASGENDG